MYSRHDARWVSESVRTIYQARTAADLVGTTMYNLGRYYPFTTIGCEELSLDGLFYIPHAIQTQARIPSDLPEHIHDNPLRYSLMNSRLVPTLHMGDTVSRNAWEKTDHYNGIARPMGFGDVFILVIQHEPSRVFISVFPEKPLEGRIYALIALLQPHLHAAWQRVQSRSDPSTKGIDSAKILLSGSGQPHSLTPDQRTLLRAYFPLWQVGATLPTELQEWTRNWLCNWDATLSCTSMRAFRKNSPRGRLLVRCFPPAHGKPAELLLTEVPVSTLGLRPHDAPTPREQEILRWISQGKRDAEIALILGVATKTVSKHVENILRKLHVETRTAAAMLRTV